MARELTTYLYCFWRIVGTYRRWNEQPLDRKRFDALLSDLPKRPAQEIAGALPAEATTVYQAYNAATWHATHRMRSARAAFDLLDGINQGFQEQFAPEALR